VFTSMDLDEKLFQQAWQLAGLRTKKAVVEEALRGAVRQASGAAGAVRVGSALVAARSGRPRRD
jgi:Arc/MetJ family transcription regulator